MKKTLDIAVGIGIIIFVYFVYLALIFPQAESIKSIASANNTITPRNIVTILDGIEQGICITLFLFGSYLALRMLHSSISLDYLFNTDVLVEIDSEDKNLSEIVVELDSLPENLRDSPLIQTLLASIRRLLITNSIQHASESILNSVESLSIRNETELSFLKYITWVIPSVGFIGTVRGIGTAMSQAEIAIAGDIGPMTESLGLAFNSTLVALVLSIPLMLLLSSLQKGQDDRVIKVQEYCEKKLIERISRKEAKS